MDALLQQETRLMILKDFKRSGIKDLGEFAAGMMKTYDDLTYELVLTDARDELGHKISGTAVSPNRKHLEDLIKINRIKTGYNILEIDCQKEFFLLLADIRDQLREIEVKTRV